MDAFDIDVWQPRTDALYRHQAEAVESASAAVALRATVVTL